VGTLSGDVVRAQLASLFRELGSRRWQTPLALDDIAALLGMRLRVSGEVANAAIAAGLLAPESGVFRLTKYGRAEASRAANSESTRVMRHADSEFSELPPDVDSEFSESQPPAFPPPSVVPTMVMTSRSDCGSRIPKESVDPRCRERSKSGSDQILDLRSDPDPARARPRTRSNPLANDQAIASAHAVIAGHAGVVNLAESADRARAISMAQTFTAARRTYQAHRSSFETGISPKMRPGCREWTHCLQAARHAESLGVDYEMYVRAQFFWFDSWFLRAPRFWELTSVRGRYNALERVRAYQREIAAGRVDPTRTLVGRQRVQPKISMAVRIQQGDRALRALMASHKATEEQVLRTFASGTQGALYFDPCWLKQNATYRRLREAGEL
jgi:hypothetical protein